MSTVRPRASAADGLRGDRELRPAEPVRDAQGAIPAFPPRTVDGHGRLLPVSAEERRARAEAARRLLTALRDLPDDDPPDTLDRLMRGIDEGRPPGRKLFEGMR